MNFTDSGVLLYLQVDGVGCVVNVERPGTVVTPAQVAQHLGQQHAFNVTFGFLIAAVGAAAATKTQIPAWLGERLR
jgi:hypothetical protein